MKAKSFEEWREAVLANPAVVHPGMSLKTLFDICREREAQDLEHGGPEHDDCHAAYDWLVFISKQERHALVAESIRDQATVRERLVKIAALACAALDSLDRNAARGGGN